MSHLLSVVVVVVVEVVVVVAHPHHLVPSVTAVLINSRADRELDHINKIIPEEEVGNTDQHNPHSCLMPLL